jgi:hypothetical protein
MPLNEITQVKIHPAIGVARVGGSQDTYFIGPEIPGKAAPPPEGGNGSYKDLSGRIARQVAKFRLYGYDSRGEVVAEITAENADISWTVHLANTKADWYNFQIAMDIPEAINGTGGTPLAVDKRNKDITGEDRENLVIDPGLRVVTGVNAEGPQYEFGTGKFWGNEVYLGELRTDEDGRLLVFGGLGHSAPKDPGTKATTFANNVNWHGDTADGTVSASVNIGGRQLPVTSSWVVVAPPDYAPGINGAVTMHDIVYEVATEIDPSLKPDRPSFTEHIYPFFKFLTNNQWVNAGFARDFGFGTPHDYTVESLIQRMANNSDSEKEFRTGLFSDIRNPDYETMEIGLLPPMYGDGVNFPATDPRQWLAVTKLQYSWLQQWANGDFVSDWPNGGPVIPDNFSDIPLSAQPAALDKAALEACLGGAFHPGCEMTWPMRVRLLYDEPFRIKYRPEPAPDFGAVLTSKIALEPGGPLDGSRPGDVSRWMAVPWQTDTSSCLYAYTDWQDDKYLPTFWPARVPNNLLTQAQFDIIMDPSKPLSDREESLNFKNRKYWLRNLPDRKNYIAVINDFITQWNMVGIAVKREGPGGEHFPRSMHVETENEFLSSPAGGTPEQVNSAEVMPSEDLPNPRLFR